MECRTISHNSAAGGIESGRSDILAGVNGVLEQTLQLGGRATAFTESTLLLGDIPELDSMAVLSVLTGLEEHFGIVVEDDDVSAETFESVGSLVSLVVDKSA